MPRKANRTRRGGVRRPVPGSFPLDVARLIGDYVKKNLTQVLNGLAAHDILGKVQRDWTTAISFTFQIPGLRELLSTDNSVTEHQVVLMLLEAIRSEVSRAEFSVRDQPDNVAQLALDDSEKPERELMSQLDSLDRAGNLPSSLKALFRKLLPVCTNEEDFVLQEPTSQILPSERVSVLFNNRLFCVRKHEINTALETDINKFYIVSNRGLGGLQQASSLVESGAPPAAFNLSAAVASNVFVDGNDVRRELLLNNTYPRMLQLTSPQVKKYIWGHETVATQNTVSGVHGREEQVYRLLPLVSADGADLHTVKADLIQHLASLDAAGGLPASLGRAFHEFRQHQQGGRKQPKRHNKSKKSVTRQTRKSR